MWISFHESSRRTPSAYIILRPRTCHHSGDGETYPADSDYQEDEGCSYWISESYVQPIVKFAVATNPRTVKKKEANTTFDSTFDPVTLSEPSSVKQLLELTDMELLSEFIDGGNLPKSLEENLPVGILVNRNSSDGEILGELENDNTDNPFKSEHDNTDNLSQPENINTDKGGGGGGGGPRLQVGKLCTACSFVRKNHVI